MRTGKTLIELAQEVERQRTTKRDFKATSEAIALGQDDLSDTPTMTLETFLTELAKCVDAGYAPQTDSHAGRLRLYLDPGNSAIRMMFCAVTAVAHRLGGPRLPLCDWGKAAQYIGLDFADARRIVDAADFPNPNDPVCRSVWKAVHQPIPSTR